MAVASTSMRQSVCEGFLRSVERFPSRPALEHDGVVLTYEQLFDRAAAVAGALAQADPTPPLAAVFAHRSVTAYVGVLGALLAGRGYVPLNRTFPPLRTRSTLTRSGARAVIVDAASAEQLGAVLSEEEPLLVVLPDAADVSDVRARLPHHDVLGAADLTLPATLDVNVLADDIAYLLFTSGSTGEPKGVGVTHRNVRHFAETIGQRYALNERDRFTQTADITFDLSVLDLFGAWGYGCCLCVMPEHGFVRPDRYIERSQPTIWVSVPSLALMMQRLGMLGPGRYPSLRWSLFCGEALPISVADDWAGAAANSTVENLYGPTELTVACTAYRWDADRGHADAEHGIVPIGEPLRGMSAVVVDEKLRRVDIAGQGELLLTGPQLTPGYWRDPKRTSVAFVHVPGREGIWYRTGDLVRRPAPGAPLTYIGRIDQQVKVRGFRVELGEVEAVLREITGHPEAVVIGWPRTAAGAEGLVGFVAGAVETRTVLEGMAERLPEFMVPGELHVLQKLPSNANGKVDRDALARFLDER